MVSHESRSRMSIVELGILGTVIAANNTAVALALGALGQYPRRWRIMGVFGIFEFFVPLLGLWVGRTTAVWIEQEVAWVGTLLLLVLGLWTFSTSFRQAPPEETYAPYLTTWTGLAALAAGLSVDNLVIGFSLGLGEATALLIATTICGFSVTFTWVGLAVGNYAGSAYRHYLSMLAGLVLIALALLQALHWI